MAREEAEWNGAIGERTAPNPCPVLCLTNPHSRGTGGGSRPFVGADADGRRWYIKPLNNGQGPRVTINEYLVASAGRLIGAPVCDTAIVKIPEELAGQTYFGNQLIEAGHAHASAEVPNAHMAKAPLRHRERDDNARRHAGVIALHDWCWGHDEQWLYDTNDDSRIYSHDHGYFLPGGRNWTVDTLRQHVDEPHAHAVTAFDPAVLVEFANALEEVQKEAIIEILAGVPPGWPVDDAELETVGFFLYRRAVAVAARLRSIAGGEQT